MDDLTKRKVIETVVYKKHYSQPVNRFRLKDLDFDIKPEDVIEVDIDMEGYYSEKNSWDPNTTIYIIRESVETLEDYNIRLLEAEKEKEDMKKRRYQSYLKLKAEFEKNGTAEILRL